MINGLDHANYNQLTRLYDLRAVSISTDDIPSDIIYTLKLIDTTHTIQNQINARQYTLSNARFITISGVDRYITDSYLSANYYNKSTIDSKVNNTNNTITQLFYNDTNLVAQIGGGIINRTSIPIYNLSINGYNTYKGTVFFGKQILRKDQI